jgi:hypothetical protein
MATNASPPPKTFTRITFSCIRCAERKVKCDRRRPCSACTKHNVECVFNSSKPPRRKQKRVKVQVLSDRLNQYEALLQKHGIDRSELPDFAPPSHPSQKGVATARLDEIQSQTPSFVEPEPGRTREDVHKANNQDRLKFVER